MQFFLIISYVSFLFIHLNTHVIYFYLYVIIKFFHLNFYTINHFSMLNLLCYFISFILNLLQYFFENHQIITTFTFIYLILFNSKKMHLLFILIYQKFNYLNFQIIILNVHLLINTLYCFFQMLLTSILYFKFFIQDLKHLFHNFNFINLMFLLFLLTLQTKLFTFLYLLQIFINPN